MRFSYFGISKKSLLIFSLWVLTTCGLGYSGIILTAVPAGMRKQNMDITVGWTGGAGRVHLRASTVPGGGSAPISHYDSLHLPSQTDAAVYSFRVNPDIPALYRNTDLRFGVNYCIASDGVSRSAEFIILIESSNAPVLSSPANAAVLKDLSPTFSWSGDAPFYTVLVSDEPFKISDSGTVTGVSAVWQIITPYSTARYGDADPSGFNSVSAPPLISGKTYNWLVLNNYGNNSASTSKVAPVPFSFVYAPSAPLAMPLLLEPKDRDTVPGVDQIVFRWALVEGAVSYKLELLEENIVDGSQADITLWKATSTGGQIVLSNASGLLRRYNYKWRVYAIGSNGAASLSEKRSFFYAVDVGNISIDLVNQVGQKLAYAPIKLNRLGGSSSAVFQGGSTDEDGHLSVNNAPLGSYEASIENLAGYASKFDTIQHKLKTGASKTITLSPVLGKIFGKISAKGTGTGILNAKVTVTGTQGSSWTSVTNSQGNYSLGVPYGNWQISAQEGGYSSATPVSVSLNSTTPSKSVDLNLEANKFTLSGTVTNSFSRQGIFGASVFLTLDGNTRTLTTDGNGNFSFSVPLGSLSLRVSSPGFSSPEPQVITIEGDKNFSVELDPNATILSGRCQDHSGTGLSAVVVMATPKSGPIRSALSDKQGYYELSLPAGDWYLTSALKGYSSQSTHKFLLDISKTVQGVDFVLNTNRSFISGRATLAGAGLAGVTIQSEMASTLTDNSGYYLLSVNSGTQTVTGTKEGNLITKVYTLGINPGDTLSNIDFSATGNAGVIKGRATAGGAGVVNALIRAVNQGNGEIFSQWTDATGAYLLSVPGGDYKISAVKEGFILDQVLSLSLPSAGTILDANLRLLSDQGNISGDVVSGFLALSGCEVSYLNEKNNALTGKTITDPQGRYSLALQSGSRYSLSASCPGYLPTTVWSDSLGMGMKATLGFNLAKAGAMYRGQVLDTRGKALTAVKVTAVKVGEQVSVTSDFDGYYQLSLGAGTFSITLSKSGYRTLVRNVQIGLGNNQATSADTLNISVGKLTGRVVSEGVPVSEAFVSLLGLSPEAGNGSFLTDSEGRFSGENIPAGNYSLTVSALGYADANLASFTLVAGQLANVEVAMVPNRARVSGMTKSNGSPIAGVTVTVNAFGISRSATTGEDGVYLIDKLPSGTYTVSASWIGFSADRIWDNQTLTQSESLTGIDFNLSKNSGSLSGTVSGAAVTSGIRISLLGKKGSRAYVTCDGTGTYSIPALPADDYTLTLTAPGYKIVGASQNPIINISKPEVFDLVLAPALFKLMGNVLDQAGQPLSGLPIEVRSSRAVFKANSGVDGVFSFSDLPAGEEYRLACKPPTAEFDPVDTAFSVAFNSEPQITIPLRTFSRRASLAGTILLDGQWVEGAVIRISGHNNSAAILSQPNGFFRVPGIAGSDKPISINISKAGAKTLDTTMVVKVGEAKSELVFKLYTLKLNLTLDLKSSENKILGTSKLIYAHGNKLDTLVTATDGRLLIPAIAANQSFTLATLLNKDEYDNLEWPVFLKENDTSLSLTAKVHKASILVHVVDQAGVKLDGAEVLINGKSTGITAAGMVQVKGLARGQYRLACGKATYRTGGETVLQITGDTSITVSLTLTKVEGGIYGTVSDTGLSVTSLNGAGPVGLASQKLPGAVVTAAFPGDTLRDTVNSLGQYFLAGATVGRKYAIHLVLPGYRPFADSVVGSSLAQKLDIVLKAFVGGIVGRVEGMRSAATLKLIHAASGSLKTIQTLPGGYFSFMDLQNQSDYVLQAQAGLLSSPAISFQANAALTRRIDLQLETWGSGLGTVRGPIPALVPLAGVKITARNILTAAKTFGMTDSLGQYAVKGLAPGKYEFSAERMGFAGSKVLPISLGQGASQDKIDFILEEASAGIAGRVQDENGQSIWADVLLVSGKDSTKLKSDAAGQFVFGGQAAGTYTLSAAKFGFASQTPISLVYSGKGLLNQNLTLAREKNILTGIIRDAFTHQFLKGVTVTAASSPLLTASSDSLGRYSLVLPAHLPSPLALGLSKEGYLPKSQLPVYLDSAGSANQDFVLTADYKFNGEISVIVKEGKDTITGLFLTVEPFFPADSLQFSLTGKAPNSFRGLRWPAPYTLRVKRNGYKDLLKVVELTPQNPVLHVPLAFPTSQIRIFMSSDGQRGKGVELNLNGLAIPENSDTAGLYISGGKLKPAQYEVAIKDAESQLIPLAPYFINLGEDSIRTDTLDATFFSVPVLDSIIGLSFPVRVIRKDSANPVPAVTCKFFFRFHEDPIWKSFALDSVKGGFLGQLPEQLRAGPYHYYHELVSPQGARILVQTPQAKTKSSGSVSYTNRQTPGKFLLRDPYLMHSIALLPQRLESDTSLYSLGAKDVFQVQVRGENGRDLNEYFDEKASQRDTSFTVSWAFSSTDYAKTLGLQLNPSSASPRLCQFKGSNRPSDSIFKVICLVRMGTVSLSKAIFVRIEDLWPAAIGIKYVKENRELEENGAELLLSNQTPDGFQFSAFAKTTEGRIFNISPRWSFGADSVIGELNQQGLFIPNSSIARSAGLVIYDTLPIGLTNEGTTLRGAFAFQTNLQTFAQVSPAAQGRTRVSNGEGTFLDFNLAGLSKSFTVSVKKPKVSGLLRSSPQEEVVGEILDIELSESQPFKADSGAVLKMPISEGIARKATVYLGHWNSKRLSWEKVDSTKNDTTVDGHVYHFSKYAVIMGSLPLGAYDFTFAPNPFSSQDPWGLQMSYKISSDVSSQVGVRIEVFNMLGDKVYESHEFQLSKGDVVKPGLKKAGPHSADRRDALGPYVWDGRDSKGTPCRNGRYMVKLIVKDGKGSKTYLKKVVMLK